MFTRFIENNTFFHKLTYKRWKSIVNELKKVSKGINRRNSNFIGSVITIFKIKE